MENQETDWDALLEKIIPDEQARIELQKSLGSTLFGSSKKSINISTSRAVVDIPVLIRNVCQVIKEEFPAEALAGIYPSQLVGNMIRVYIKVDAVKELSRSAQLPAHKEVVL